jgi:hypothetical protein
MRLGRPCLAPQGGRKSDVADVGRMSPPSQRFLKSIFVSGDVGKRRYPYRRPCRGLCAEIETAIATSLVIGIGTRRHWQRCRRYHHFTLAASLRSNFIIIHNTTLPFSQILPSPSSCRCPSRDLHSQKSENPHLCGVFQSIAKDATPGCTMISALGRGTDRGCPWAAQKMQRGVGTRAGG